MDKEIRISLDRDCRESEMPERELLAFLNNLGLNPVGSIRIINKVRWMAFATLSPADNPANVVGRKFQWKHYDLFIATATPRGESYGGPRSSTKEQDRYGRNGDGDRKYSDPSDAGNSWGTSESFRNGSSGFIQSSTFYKSDTQGKHGDQGNRQYSSGFADRGMNQSTPPGFPNNSNSGFDDVTGKSPDKDKSDDNRRRKHFGKTGEPVAAKSAISQNFTDSPHGYKDDREISRKLFGGSRSFSDDRTNAGNSFTPSLGNNFAQSNTKSSPENYDIRKSYNSEKDSQKKAPIRSDPKNYMEHDIRDGDLRERDDFFEQNKTVNDSIGRTYFHNPYSACKDQQPDYENKYGKSPKGFFSEAKEFPSSEVCRSDIPDRTLSDSREPKAVRRAQNSGYPGRRYFENNALLAPIADRPVHTDRIGLSQKLPACEITSPVETNLAQKGHNITTSRCVSFVEWKASVEQKASELMESLSIGLKPARFSLLSSIGSTHEEDCVLVDDCLEDIRLVLRSVGKSVQDGLDTTYKVFVYKEPEVKITTETASQSQANLSADRSSQCLEELNGPTQEEFLRVLEERDKALADLKRSYFKESCNSSTDVFDQSTEEEDNIDSGNKMLETVNEDSHAVETDFPEEILPQSGRSSRVSLGNENEADQITDVKEESKKFLPGDISSEQEEAQHHLWDEPIRVSEETKNKDLNDDQEEDNENKSYDPDNENEGEEESSKDSNDAAISYVPATILMDTKTQDGQFDSDDENCGSQEN